MPPLLPPDSPHPGKLWGELPANLLPIGDTDGGDMTAIRFLPVGSEVVVLDHEDDLREMLRTSTFIELLLSCCSLEDEEEELT